MMRSNIDAELRSDSARLIKTEITDEHLRELTSALAADVPADFTKRVMEEIRKEAVARGIARYDEYIREGLESEIPFKGVGQAYIRFAREEPMIFRMLFMLPREKVPELPENDRNYEMVLRSAQSSSRTEREKAAEIYEKMWIFVHGVATLQAGGLLPYDEKRVGKMSSEVFAALTLFEHQKEEEEDE